MTLYKPSETPEYFTYLFHFSLNIYKKGILFNFIGEKT